MAIQQQHPKSAQILQAMDDSEPFVNAIWKAHRENKMEIASAIQKLQEQYFLMNSEKGICASSAVVGNLGSPDFKMKGTEHNPGAWFFKHEPSNIGFVVWSDGYKKKASRGTSVEYYNCNDVSLLPYALHDMLEYLIVLHPDVLQNHQNEIKQGKMER